MNKDISTYLHKHTSFITATVILVFLVLFAGEYYLYRNEMKLNKMLSEGLMQIKESQQTQPTTWPSIQPTLKK